MNKLFILFLAAFMAFAIGCETAPEGDTTTIEVEVEAPAVEEPVIEEVPATDDSTAVESDATEPEANATEGDM